MKKQNAPKLAGRGALMMKQIAFSFYQYAPLVATVSALIGIAAFLLLEVVK